MLKRHVRRLARPLIILLVLVAAVAAPASNSPVRKASAFYLCEQCDFMYQHCISNCAPSCTAADENRCENRRLSCWAYCD